MVKIRQTLKLFLLICLATAIFLLQGCFQSGEKQPSNQNPRIVLEMEIVNFDRKENTFSAQLIIKSQINTVKIAKMEILHPSYVLPSAEGRKESIELLKGESDTLIIKFEITKSKSFKLKGVVYGSYHNGNMKFSNIGYLFFYFNGEKYIDSDNINDILGKRKLNGLKIRKKDLRVFNKLEADPN